MKNESIEIRHLLMRKITYMSRECDTAFEFITLACELREKWEDLMTDEDNAKVSEMSIAIMKCFDDEFTK